MRTSTCMILILLAGCQRGAGPTGQTTFGDLQISWRLAPDPPVAGSNTLELWIRGADPEPTAVETNWFMPAMGSMPAMRGQAKATRVGSGHWRAALEPSMAGSWDVTARIARPGKPDVLASFRLQVGVKGLVPATTGGTGLALPSDVQLDPRAVALAGVRTEAVTRRDLSREIRAAGKVDFDERRVRVVAARVAGRIDKLEVAYTGAKVQAGQRLLLLYSPQVVASEQEYLLAAQTEQTLGGSPHGGGASLRDAARERLQLWGLTEAELAEIDRTQKPRLQMSVVSPIGGTVIEKPALAGKYVQEGEMLYKVADLSTVWVLADLYERELSWIAPGAPLEVETPSYPGRRFRGTVSFVAPTIDPQTRTVRVRVQLGNGDGALKPEMFVTCVLHPPAARAALAVPKSALIRTGKGALVYLEVAPGTYRPAPVEIGIETSDLVEVRGLAEGARVVVAGNFLIDSQTRLQTGASGQWGGAQEVKP